MKPIANSFYLFQLLNLISWPIGNMALSIETEAFSISVEYDHRVEESIVPPLEEADREHLIGRIEHATGGEAGMVRFTVITEGRSIPLLRKLPSDRGCAPDLTGSRRSNRTARSTSECPAIGRFRATAKNNSKVGRTASHARPLEVQPRDL